MKLLILNGPNLNLVGKREPEIYGDSSFEAYYKKLKTSFDQIELEYYQSNVEGEIINKLHEVGFDFDGIVLNAGGYTHTSVAIADAVKAIECPVIEVHISNVLSREVVRHTSLIGPNVKGSIMGFGLDSYRLALEAFMHLLK